MSINRWMDKFLSELNLSWDLLASCTWMTISFLGWEVFSYYFFFIKFIYLFYFWLCWVFIAVHGFSLVVASGGYSLVVMPGLLIVLASLVAECGLTCSTAFEIFPAAAAKSLQSCLCDPIDGNAPGSPVPGTLQARVLEWIAFPY